MDPATWFFSSPWADVGGWSLFVGLSLFIIIGAFREWWTPGARSRRLEEAAQKSADALAEAMKQNGQLITSNEITKHFFEETTPKRGA